VKGKAWTVEEEQKLRELMKSGDSHEKIAAILGKTTEAVRQKIIKLKLEEQQQKISSCSSSKLDAEGELQSVEEALKLLNGALKALDDPGLGKTEILRFRTIIQGARIYMDVLADYIEVWRQRS